MENELYSAELLKVSIYKVDVATYTVEHVDEVWNGRDSDEKFGYVKEHTYEKRRKVTISRVASYPLYQKIKAKEEAARTYLNSAPADIKDFLSVSPEKVRTYLGDMEDCTEQPTCELDTGDEVAKDYIVVRHGIRGEYVVGVLSGITGYTVYYSELTDNDTDGLWNAAFMVEETLERPDERYKLPNP